MKHSPHPSKSMTRSAFLLSLATPALLLAAPSSGDGRLSADEITEIVDLLNRSRSDTLTKLAALNDEQWNFRTDPDRWAAGQVAEHLYLTEMGFHSQVDNLMKDKPVGEWAKLAEGKVQVITQVIPDRGTRFQAPPEAVPQGKVSRAEIVREYASARTKMIERVLDGTKPYKAHIAESGTPLGPLRAAHWLRFAGLHNTRHNKQIDEVLTDSNFPR